MRQAGGVGAVLEEELDDFGVIVFAGQEERGLSRFGPRVDVAGVVEARAEEELDLFLWFCEGRDG